MRSEDVKTPAFFSAGCRVRSSFVSFVRLINRLHGLDLTIDTKPYSFDCRTLKQFCCGLIEGDRLHPWYSALHVRRIPRGTRMSIAMSLFLFRKVLPSPEPNCDSYVERMSEESPLPDGGFLRFVQREIRKMFPSGWDKLCYPNAVLQSTIPVKSCVQRSMGKGGSRLEVLSRTNGWNSHQSFVLEALTSETRSIPLPSRVTAVETAGKWRIVSVGDVDMNILRPLHTAIYNRISRFDWLLRGEADPGKFSKFTTGDGMVFTSGDYESATDNLNIYVQKVILNGILRGTNWVPDHVKELARMSQEMELVGPSGLTLRQRRGQLMGNLLSFPLLCLVNYLAFIYYTKDRSIPVKINGDDIVFRSSREVSDRWAKGIVGSGLVLSQGKTLVDAKYFTLNSRLFRGKGGKPTLVPSIRSTAFGYRKICNGSASLAGRWRRVLKDYPCGRLRRQVLEEEFLKWNSGYIVASRRSLTRGLDIKFSFESISRTNLWRREAFYLALEKEFVMPAQPSAFDQQRVPDGWELRRVENPDKETIDISRMAGAEFVQCAWSPMSKAGAERQQEYRDKVNLGPVYCNRRVSRSKRSRLLGISPANTQRFLRPTVLRDGRVLRDPRLILEISRPRGKRMWLPSGYRSSKIRQEENQEEDEELFEGNSFSVCSSLGIITFIPMDFKLVSVGPPTYFPYHPSRVPPFFECLDTQRWDETIRRFCRMCGGRFLPGLTDCNC